MPGSRADYVPRPLSDLPQSLPSTFLFSPPGLQGSMLGVRWGRARLNTRGRGRSKIKVGISIRGIFWAYENTEIAMVLPGVVHHYHGMYWLGTAFWDPAPHQCSGAVFA